jgi:hypothetical protein
MLMSPLSQSSGCSRIEWAKENGPCDGHGISVQLRTPKPIKPQTQTRTQTHHIRSDQIRSDQIRSHQIRSHPTHTKEHEKEEMC